MNQEHSCLGGASLFQPYLSAALLSTVRARCAVCRCGAPAWTVFPGDVLGLGPAGLGVSVSQCSEAVMPSPVQDSASLVDRPDPASLTHVSSRLYFKGTTR